MRMPAAQRRTQLLDTAVHVFAERGYHAASMNDVAEAAGVTKPVLYQHFSSKRDLFVELLTAGPARILGLETGTLAPGRPGDLTLLALDREVTVDPATFRSKGRNTPFAGWKLRGAPVGTILGGVPVRLP